MSAHKVHEAQQKTKRTSKKASTVNKSSIKTDVMRDLVNPLIAASFVGFSIIANLNTSDKIISALFIIFIFASQIFPWIIFRSYAANNYSFTSYKQKRSLFIGWFLIYGILGNSILYNLPHLAQVKSSYEPEIVLQTLISIFTLNQSIRILGILFNEDWFKVKGITTPTQAMFVFNALMVIKFRNKKQDAKSVWIEKITELWKFVVRMVIDVILLKIGAYLYYEYKAFIDPKPILYYELSAIYTAINVDYLLNRVNWITLAVYGGTMDYQHGFQSPVLSSSPRDFWRREAVCQREALKLGIFKPMMKKTGNYWLSVAFVFLGNCVVHMTLTAQMTFEYFAFYEWGLIFVVMFIAVIMELFTEKYLLKKMKLEFVKQNMFYKVFWFIVLHVSMSVVVYIGVPKLVPLGLESSYYFLDHWW